MYQEPDPSQWEMPSWYRGFDDPNEVEGAKFSPFTLLDTVSPGRAWFNEVNFSDENCNNAKQFVEICFPAGYDMTEGQQTIQVISPTRMGTLGTNNLT